MTETTNGVRTVVALVQDKPGILAEVTIAIRRRGVNIDGLSVGASERSGFSRMTIEASSYSFDAEIKREDGKVVRQHIKSQSPAFIARWMQEHIIGVVTAEDVTEQRLYRAELAVFKVTLPTARHAELIAKAEEYSARLGDITDEAVIFDFVGHDGASIKMLQEILESFSPEDLVLKRSGPVVMLKGKTPPEFKTPAL